MSLFPMLKRCLHVPTASCRSVRTVQFTFDVAIDRQRARVSVCSNLKEIQRTGE